MRLLDIPPVWLVGFLIVTWFSPWLLPWGGLFTTGAVLFLVAGAITIAAVFEFLRAKTTFVPRRDPSALITTGIFSVTRNPIYLADALILLALSLIWGRVLGLLLVVPFLWLLERRFVLGEEARLREEFGEAFDNYASRTRRWL